MDPDLYHSTDGRYQKRAADDIDAVDDIATGDTGDDEFEQEIEYANQVVDQYRRARHYLRQCAFHGNWVLKQKRFAALYAKWRREGDAALATFRTDKSRRAAELVFGMIATLNGVDDE